MLSQAVSVNIDCNISASLNGIEVLDGLNNINKRFLFQLMSNMQLPGAAFYYTQMVIHTGTRTSDVSLASEFQKHLYTVAHKHGVIDQGK